MAIAMPCARVALVGEDPLGPCPRSPCALSRDVNALDRVGEHRRVVDVPRRQHHIQRSPPAIGNQMDFAGQTASGAADRMIRRLLAQNPVIPSRPLWCAQGSRRAGAPG